MANRLAQTTADPAFCGAGQAGIAYRKLKIIFIAGPTAIGKTEIAVCLAKKINGEIISCDSMQVYKGMDIIASCPGIISRKKVPHHLIGIISPRREYNVCRYNRDALKKVSEISKRGKTPIFCGGTGLYMNIVLDGIFKAGPPNQAIRRRLYQQADKYGQQYLYRRLEKVDPRAAAKIHPHDTKRIVRALEVFEVTAQPISKLWKQRSGIYDKYDVKIFCLNLAQDKLYRRIKQRTEKMFRQGLISEAKRLLKMKLSRTAVYAIGIRELKGYFCGEYGLGQAKQLIQHNSCLYAKRQLTWFRKDKRINWVNIDTGDTPAAIAERIAKKI